MYFVLFCSVFALQEKRKLLDEKAGGGTVIGGHWETDQSTAMQGCGVGWGGSHHPNPGGGVWGSLKSSIYCIYKQHCFQKHLKLPTILKIPRKYYCSFPNILNARFLFYPPGFYEEFIPLYLCS